MKNARKQLNEKLKAYLAIGNNEGLYREVTNALDKLRNKPEGRLNEIYEAIAREIEIGYNAVIKNKQKGIEQKVSLEDVLYKITLGTASVENRIAKLNDDASGEKPKTIPFSPESFYKERNEPVGDSYEEQFFSELFYSK